MWVGLNSYIDWLTYRLQDGFPSSHFTLRVLHSKQPVFTFGAKFRFRGLRAVLDVEASSDPIAMSGARAYFNK